jgi:hypothetical protein
LIILIGNSELQITIRKKNDVVPCPKKGGRNTCSLRSPLVTLCHWIFSFQHILYYLRWTCYSRTKLRNWLLDTHYKCLPVIRFDTRTSFAGPSKILPLGPTGPTVSCISAHTMMTSFDTNDFMSKCMLICRLKMS